MASHCSGYLGYYMILGIEPPGPLPPTPPEPPTPTEPTIEVAPKHVFLNKANHHLALTEVITSEPDIDWEAY